MELDEIKETVINARRNTTLTREGDNIYGVAYAESSVVVLKGNDCLANAHSFNTTVCIKGRNGLVKGRLGTKLEIVNYDENGKFINNRIVIVDGINILEDCYYFLNEFGEFCRT